MEINKKIVPNNIRHSNIDCLRALCAIFVLFEHFCETDVHGAFRFASETSMAAYFLLQVLYSIARVAVPCFFLISGFLSINSQKQNFGKIITLFVMTFFYSLIPIFSITIIKIFKGEFNFFMIYKMIIETLIVKNYYLYLFVAVYTLSPFINLMIKQLNKKQYKRLLVLVFILFSFWSTLINTYISLVNKSFTGCYFTSRTGTSMGFNIANFAMLYIIGGYIRFFHEDDCIKYRIPSFVILFTLSFLTALSKIFIPSISKAFLYYDSFFVILNSIMLFIIFLSYNICENKLISFMGKNTFGTYLIHGYAMICIMKVTTVKSVVTKGFLGTLEGILIFVIGGYILSLIISWIISFTFLPLSKWWKTTKLYSFPILLTSCD